MHNTTLRSFQYLFALIIFLLISLPAHSAKSFRIERIDIDARILSDGRMQIEEARTYRFRGSFKWADYRLPLSDLGNVEDFSIQDESGLFMPGNDEQPQTYELQQNADELYVRWYYRAKNESRRFVLKYTVTDAVKVYDDVAEFYFKFIGEANKKQVGAVETTLHLPQPAFHPEVRAWAHGPLNGRVQFKEGELFFDVAPLPRKTYWEARVTFPSEWVAQSNKRVSGSKLNSILEEEAKYADEANRRRAEIEAERQFRAGMATPVTRISGLLLIVGFLLIAYFYNKAGRPHDVHYDQSIDPNLPEGIHPALVNVLNNSKNVGGGAIAATIFHLASSGILTITEKESASKRKKDFAISVDRAKWEIATADLLPFEQDLLTFYFDELSHGEDSIDAKSIKKARSKMQKWFQRWRKLIKQEVSDTPIYEKTSVKLTIIAAVYSFAVIIAGVLMVIFLSNMGVLAIVGGAALILFSLIILRMTPEMKLNRKKWKALKNYLQKIHMQQSQAGTILPNISRYLVFAVALGVSAKAIKRLMEFLPEGQHTVFIPWYAAILNANNSPAAIAESVSSIVAATTSTISSASGAGGGAAVGGGGGAGGAAGGAG